MRVFVLSGFLPDSLCDIYSDIEYGMLFVCVCSFYLAFCLTVYVTYILTFYMTFFLWYMAFFVAYEVTYIFILSDRPTAILSDIIYIYLHIWMAKMIMKIYLTFYPAHLLTLYLSFCLAFYVTQ